MTAGPVGDHAEDRAGDRAADRAGTPVADATGDRLVELFAVMRRLRAECGWKRQQTHRSLARYLLEETYETLEAIEADDPDHLCEELGDLLLQVYFHAVLAAEAGRFTLEDVAAGILDKLYRRNPHVFGPAASDRPAGSAQELDAAAVNELWESAKAAERQRSSPLDGLPAGLPALLYAVKVIDRLERRGTPVPTDPGAPDLGERLLTLVAEAHASGVDPEQALRDAVRRRV